MEIPLRALRTMTQIGEREYTVKKRTDYFTMRFNVIHNDTNTTLTIRHGMVLGRSTTQYDIDGQKVSANTQHNIGCIFDAVAYVDVYLESMMILRETVATRIGPGDIFTHIMALAHTNY